MKRALVTGITGQDGSYLAEFLLEKGYEVFGLVRRTSHHALERISHLKDRLKLISGDLADQASLDDAVRSSRPDEVYNLAAQSFVAASWNQPLMTSDVTGLAVTRLLESIRRNRPEARFYEACSSEVFGAARETPQKETTPFNPLSPYAVAKAYGHHMTICYRESFKMFAVSGICFNHESPRRGIEFVTRKISFTASMIKAGMKKELILGNLEAKRDWGFAGDYVKAMWAMLQQAVPDDFVVATGESHSVRDFAMAAFKVLDLDWEGHVRIDESLMRPAEVPALKGDASKARDKLGWKPDVRFDQLVELMVKSDYDGLRSGRLKPEVILGASSQPDPAGRTT